MSLLSDIWAKSCEYIKEEIPNVSYNTWIKDVVPYKMTDDKIYLSVKTDIIKNMLDNRYKDLIINSVLEASGKNYLIFVTVGDEKEKTEEEEKKSFAKKENNLK